MMNLPIKQLSELELSERIKLVQDLWDTIATQEEDVPVAQWQKDELDRRKKNYQATPQKASSWEEVKKRITQKNA